MAYLIKDRNGTFYIRLVLTKAQQRAFGRREYRRSLGTKSKREASRLQPQAYLEAMRFLAVSNQHDQPLPLSIPDTSPLLSVVFKDYKEHLSRMGYQGRTIDGKDSVIEFLMNTIGDKPVDQYQRSDIRSLSDTLLKMPRSFQRMLSKGLTIKQIININQGKPTITIQSHNNYMAVYIAVFNYAIKEGYIENNPFQKTRIQQKKLKSAYRDIFTKEDMKTIFCYVEGKIEGIDRKYKDSSKNVIRADRYWLTYLGYYTGGRLNELAQLWKEDIYQHNGIWCIHIRSGNDKQRLKNLNSERLIPVHKDLIDLGFIDYVSEQEGHIFPMIPYLPKHGYASKPSTWFTQTLKKLKLGEDRKLSYHSFRHTVANILKQSGVESHMTASLLGHSTGSISYDRYGKTLTPDALIPVIQAIPSIIL